MSGDVDDPLESAWEALDAGDAEGALARVVDADADDPDRALLEATAQTDLGRFDEAAAALARATGALGADDPGVLWARGELALRAWRVEEARAAFERLVVREPGPAVLERLALCLELDDDLGGADACYARAAHLDPAGGPSPPRFDAAGFDRVLDAALADLPGPYRAVLANTRIVVEPVPFRELVDPAEPAATPPDACGLFVGASRVDAPSEETATMPPSIYLFQRNLERIARDEEELAEEIRITLYHEIGHLLGFDEEGVEAMGLG